MYCRVDVLINERNRYVSKCRGCGKVVLHYNNFMTTFNEGDFESFLNYVSFLHFESNAVRFPNGKPFITVYTCHEDIYFVFNEEEFDDFRDCLSQVKVMLEVKEILKM